MKLTSRTKKLLLLSAVVLVVVFLTGCRVPMDENNHVIYIANEAVPGSEFTFRTSFSDVIANENWFNALFVYPLAWLINKLSPIISVGGAIAVVTITVNGLLAALTIKSSIATQQMQLLQPEMDRIQRKYEGRDDEASKMRMAQETQALYKKYDINPLSTILVTFLQFPIIMAMYMAVHRSWAVQSGTFLGMNLQTTPLNGMKLLLQGDMGGLPYLFLFIFMGACQFLAMKLPQMIQKKKAEEEAAKHHRKPVEPSTQNQVMQYYMVGMILVFGLMWPSAMSLYWAINSLVTIGKTLIVQKIIDDKNAK
ncbi:MAG: membrane protein insertase YidC [Solobacterium sp.]|nr:membrane protein insertase YidC [Solobacterium sp.]